jgi:hypothetical protein
LTKSGAEIIKPCLWSAPKTREHAVTSAQYSALSDLSWSPEIWWHDLPTGTREVLHRRRWLRVARRVACVTHGHEHPGYVTISQRGMNAFTRERIRRGD